jgi:hypothetical protein
MTELRQRRRGDQQRDEQTRHATDCDSHRRSSLRSPTLYRVELICHIKLPSRAPCDLFLIGHAHSGGSSGGELNPISWVRLLLGSTLINHKGHHGHKGKPTCLTFVSVVSFVVMQRRYGQPKNRSSALYGENT